MYWVPSYLKHSILPCIAVVTVEVADVVADVVNVEDTVDVTVDVLGYVVTVEVTVVDTVVKSQLVYPPDCQRPMARLSAAAVVAHLVNGDPPDESFKKPSGLHCTVPKSESTYGVMSSITLFKITAPTSHALLSANFNILWFSVTESRWHSTGFASPSHCSMI